MEFDNIDRKLLALLQKDSKVTTKRLSLNLNLSKTAVYERIKKLEKAGVIEKYVEPIIHMFSIFYPLITALLAVKFGIYGEANLGRGCWFSNPRHPCSSSSSSNHNNDAANLTKKCVQEILVPIGKSKNTGNGIDFGWISVGIPVPFMIITNLMFNMIVFCFVRKTTIYIHHHRSRQSHGNGSSVNRGGGGGPTQIQIQRVQLVGTQSLLYVLCFIVTCFPTFVLRIIEDSGRILPQDENSIYLLLVIQSITFPLIGFCNFVVFIRPTYIRTRKHFPRATRSWVLRRALYGNEVRPEEVAELERHQDEDNIVALSRSLGGSRSDSIGSGSGRNSNHLGRWIWNRLFTRSHSSSLTTLQGNNNPNPLSNGRTVSGTASLGGVDRSCQMDQENGVAERVGGDDVDDTENDETNGSSEHHFPMRISLNDLPRSLVVDLDTNTDDEQIEKGSVK